MRELAPKTAHAAADPTPVRHGRREDILVMAGRMFREKGFHATSMRDLAKAIDMRGSSLYAHFAAKEDVLWEIVTHAAAAFEAAVDGVPDDLPPRSRLAAMIVAHLGVVAAELDTATVFFQDWLHLGDERRHALVGVRDAYQQRFEEVIAEGRACGAFRVDDPGIAALIILSALNWSYQWLDPDGRLDLGALADAYAGQLLDGLSGEAPDPDSSLSAVPSRAPNGAMVR